MLIAFGVGIVIGILIIIGVLRLTMSEDPTGCLALFGALIFFVCWSALVVRWVVLAG